MSHEDYEKTACSGDCRLNTPVRCPCPERCASVTQIMRQQRRFLHQHSRYVRPSDQRGRSVNLAECVTLLTMPGEMAYGVEGLDQWTNSCYAVVIDSATGCKAICDFYGVDDESIRPMIESYFSGPVFEVAPRVWVA